MVLKKKCCCPECGKLFASKAGLSSHARIHQETKAGNKNARSSTATTVELETALEPVQAALVENKKMLVKEQETKPAMEESKEIVAVEDEQNEEEPKTGLTDEQVQEKRKAETKEPGTSSKKIKIQHSCQKCSKTFALHKTLKRHERFCQENDLEPPKQEPTSTRSSTRKSATKPISYSDYDFKDSDESDNDENNDKIETEDEESSEEFKDQMKGVKPYHCEMCKKQFSRKYHLFRHMQQTGCGGTPPPTFPCQVCGKLFNRNDNLREHLRIHAGDTIRKRKHTCEHCNKEFHCPSMLTVHIRTHTGEKPFQCELCKKAFPSEGALKKHGRVHSGERPYECKECGSRFSLKGTLNRHLRTHSGIRPHKCQFCPREFIQIGGLKAHLFYHTGENGFSCERCGKCFNRKARLDMHIRYVHEKVKPYNCKECGKSFVRKEDLNRHSVLHTGVKAFQCPTCDKTFAIQPSLKLHLLTHRREPPKSCEECGRAFIRQDCLLRHMRKRHRDVLDRLIANVEKKVLPVLKTDVTTADPLQKQSLEDSIKELLSLLVDEATLKAFGWPDKAIDELLEAVINRCGHTPVDPGDYSFMDRLRENCKLLFTVVIDDTAVKTLLNNHTVDEVILHVLRLAKT